MDWVDQAVNRENKATDQVVLDPAVALASRNAFTSSRLVVAPPVLARDPYVTSASPP